MVWIHSARKEYEPPRLMGVQLKPRRRVDKHPMRLRKTIEIVFVDSVLNRGVRQRSLGLLLQQAQTRTH